VSSADEQDERRRPRLLGAADYDLVENAFREFLPVQPTTEDHLRGVLVQVIEHPGSLVRAQLVFGILRAHHVSLDASRSLATAIEYFHTASLIFDDLPSMDDATTRRGQSCPHVVHGEAAAVLGALCLINQGYALLWRVLSDLPGEARMRASRLVAECLGTDGILNGQALDLQFDDAPATAARVQQVAEGKTVSLVRLSLLLPAIVAGAGDEVLERLERVSHAWGLGYQILDDFKDCLMSRTETGKSTDMDRVRRRPNLPATIGREEAMDRLSALLADSEEALRPLALAGERWTLLMRLQAILESERCEIRSRLRRRVCA